MDPFDRSGRLEALQRLADACEDRADELAGAIVRTTGKTLRVARGDVASALARLRAFGDVVPNLDGRGPVGFVAAVLPSNASLSNPVATIGNAFLAGNRVVARFPGASRDWGEVVEPLITEHLSGVTFDHGSGRRFLQGVIEDPEISVIMVFGDDSWARDYEGAVQRHRKKLIFEGPGNDPFLVLPGADVERAARDAVRGACFDAGQACTSPERFYVHRDLADSFVERVVDLVREEIVGDPEDPMTTLGPIRSERVVERIEAQLRDARSRGARILTGGGIRPTRLPEGSPGAFVEPTVLAGVRPEMAVMTEETFGPVLPIQVVDDAATATALAADSRYGLSATLQGGGSDEQEALERSHGLVFRNEIWTDYFARELHAPYGGRKDSGWVWEWRNDRFARRDGSRVNSVEFSRPVIEKRAIENQIPRSIVSNA